MSMKIDAESQAFRRNASSISEREIRNASHALPLMKTSATNAAAIKEIDDAYH